MRRLDPEVRGRLGSPAIRIVASEVDENSAGGDRGRRRFSGAALQAPARRAL